MKAAPFLRMRGEEAQKLSELPIVGEVFGHDMQEAHDAFVDSSSFGPLDCVLPALVPCSPQIEISCRASRVSPDVLGALGVVLSSEACYLSQALCSAWSTAASQEEALPE